MAKLDYEKDRRKRLKKDICVDAPWRNEDTRFVVSSGPAYEYFGKPDRGRKSSKNGAAAFVPVLPGVLERLESMAASLRGPYFPNWLPQHKRRELKDMRAKLRRIVEREGSAIKATPAYRLAEAACRRESAALRPAKRKRKRRS